MGFDTDGSKMYWASEDEFHQKKSVIETEITIANRLRFIPINTGNNTGLGIVALV